MALVGPFQLRVFCDSMKINVILENFGIYQACWRILPLKKKLCYVLIIFPKIGKVWERLPNGGYISFIMYYKRFHIFWKTFGHIPCDSEEEGETGGVSVCLLYREL